MNPLSLNPFAALGGLAVSLAAGALAWNYTPVIGPAAVQGRLQKDLGAATSANQTLVATLTAERKACASTTAERDRLLISNGQTESSNAQDLAELWKGQCLAAYKAGAARAAVAAPPAPANSGGGPGGAPGGGVRPSLRDLWSAGAYAGSAAHSSSGDNGGRPAGAAPAGGG